MLDGLFGLDKRLFDVDIEAADGEVSAVLYAMSSESVCVLGRAVSRVLVQNRELRLQSACAREHVCAYFVWIVLGA